MESRPRKHWGWGYEDEQLSAEELRSAAAHISQQLGFGSSDVELPVPLSAVTLPQPRLSIPPALSAICSTDGYERAFHAYGSSYRDIVRAYRGQFDHPPDVVAFPRSEDDLVEVLDWAIDAGAAVIPFGGGTSVVGGVEPVIPERFAGAVTIDMRR